MDDQDDEKPERRRDRDRRQRKEMGKRSGDLARALMQIEPNVIARLALEDDTREMIERAHAIVSRPARRRAERELAGHLRKVEIGAIEAQLEQHRRSQRANARLFQQAESWRDRLLSDEPEVVKSLHDEFAGLDPDHWEQLIGDARRQRATGKPKGASKALFRAIMHALEAAQE